MSKKFLLENVFKPIENAGFRAWFVGGCVRDNLWGKEPHDFDICTDATPEDLHKIFSRFSSKNSEPFGVTIILLKNEDGIVEEIEIATLRRDITKGRHPKIEFTDCITEDAERRDFTINALFEDSEGRVWDPTEQGKSDIESNTLRFIGSVKDRLSEDPLRAWRFVRFLSAKCLQPAEGTLEEFEDACKNIDFSEVSRERQLKEFKQILAGKNFLSDDVQKAIKAARIWEELGFEEIFNKMRETKQSFKWHAEGATIKLADGTITQDVIGNLDKIAEIVEWGNVFDHTMKVVRLMHKQIWETEFDEETRFLLMLSAFLHDCGKPFSDLGVKHSEFDINGIHFVEDIKKVSDHDVVGAPIAFDFCKKLCLSNDECAFVSNLVLHHMRMHQILNMKKTSKIWKFVHTKDFDKLVMLAKADEEGCTKTANDEWTGIVKALEKEVELKTEQGIKLVTVAELAKTDLPEPVINGHDLIKAGFKPSPKFKKALDIAFNVQIDQCVTNKDSLIKMAKTIL